jgi:thiol-disulfide isomerase/thioredoxin
MSGLREQIGEAYATARAPDATVARLRSRIETARRRSGSARTRWALAVGAAAALAAWSWVAVRPTPPAAGASAAGLRVVAARGGAIAGHAGTFFTLEDAAGARYHLVQADLQGESGPEAIEVALDGATLRVSRMGGVLVGLAAPRDAGSPPAVHRARSMVSAGGDHLPTDEAPMTDPSTRQAASRLTRAALLALATLAVPSTLPAAEAPAAHGAPAAAKAAPALYAVKVHADWCPACRKVGQVFDDLARRLADEPVMFVELDVTDESTLRQSEYLAAALRLDEAWGERRGAGYILLVDAATRRVVARMNLDLGLDELERRTKDAL